MRSYPRPLLLLLLLLLSQHPPAYAARVHHARHLPPPPQIRVIRTLMAQLGKPYRWGGDSPHTGFDCSGLIYYTWHKNFHINLPRTAKGMYSMPQARQISFHQLAPGDMIFFAMHGENIDHVGVYLGEGHFIEAPHTGQNVKIANLDRDNYRRHYRGARRFLTGKQRAG